MDISVMNAYQKLVKVCERIDSLRKKEKYEISLNNLLAEDIHDFICVISKSGAEKRYNYFNEVYQDGAYPASDLLCSNNDELPAVFCALNEFDSTGTGMKTVQTAGLFVAFVSELGKYYLLSRFDKKEVISKKYID